MFWFLTDNSVVVGWDAGNTANEVKIQDNLQSFSRRRVAGDAGTTAKEQRPTKRMTELLVMW